MLFRVPFGSGMMLSSIIGFIVSVLVIMDWSETWGFTFSLVCVILFISSIVSMSRVDADNIVSLEDLAVHEHKRLKSNAKNKR